LVLLQDFSAASNRISSTALALRALQRAETRIRLRATIRDALEDAAVRKDTCKTITAAAYNREIAKKVIVGSANAVAMKDTVVDTAASRRAATADLVNVTVTRGKIITETVTVDVSASEASSGTNTAIAFPKTCVQGRKAAERTRNGPTKRKFSRDVAKHRIVWIHCPSTVPCTQRLEVAFAKKAM
jgi:hypothetical protein